LVQKRRRQEVVDLLRRAGLAEIADEAMAELPDHMSEEELERWAGQHGVTIDVLISQMGGSP
jgi:hypothetical protein